MFTIKQIELVKNSWAYVLHNSHETGTIFYQKLFEIDPASRQLFNGDIKRHSQKLVSLITSAVRKLHNFDEILTEARILGIEYKRNSVRAEHYTSVAAALLWTLEKTLCKEWNEEVKEAWTTIYNTISITMIGATDELRGIL